MFRHFSNSTFNFSESCLIEAYNLKAAIDYKLGNIQDAREALSEMPVREEEELDSVTLHNLALVCIEKDPDDSFKKLNFLLKVYNDLSPASTLPARSFGKFTNSLLQV
jgi:tetratricopeptide repeat protein 30